MEFVLPLSPDLYIHVSETDPVFTWPIGKYHHDYIEQLLFVLRFSSQICPIDCPDIAVFRNAK